MRHLAEIENAHVRPRERAFSRNSRSCSNRDKTQIPTTTNRRPIRQPTRRNRKRQMREHGAATGRGAGTTQAESPPPETDPAAQLQPSWKPPRTVRSAAMRNWTTSANGPPASWTKNSATPTCRCCATSCPCWTTSSGRSRRPSKTPTPGRLLNGFKMVRQQVEDVLKRHHCQQIEALYAPFDPHIHHAVMQQASDEHPANTVLMVTQNGYQLHDRVVRPSQVIVSTAK